MTYDIEAVTREEMDRASSNLERATEWFVDVEKEFQKHV